MATVQDENPFTGPIGREYEMLRLICPNAAPLAGKLADHLATAQPGALLMGFEIGCGTGVSTLPLLAKNAGLHLLAIDSSAKMLAQAREKTGLAIVTEVMSDTDAPLVSQYADILQVGARNMQNFALLKSLGRCGKPVLLKRGLSSTIKELLMSAEYIVAHGNPDVILCERGIRTFETATRNTCDISAVPVLRELTLSLIHI